ncbi:SDR family oxidoreductase [Pseudolysinimonas sp.]|uniref:SDR family oxidoreductase n=1 Tax=Pseudolysinimonas sp. TaxID=2680009 RepID=UPI003F7DABA5
MALRILFIGGTGTISTSVSELVLRRGHDLAIVTRGTTPVPDSMRGVETLRGDAGDPASLAAAIGDREFDVVVNFRAFLPEQVAADIQLFRGRTGQYVFISSASAYQKPVERLPITESTPLRNPFWQYSRDKIASEDLLVAAYRNDGFPMTIIRPSHTYTSHSVPIFGRWTAVERMRAGKPVVVHGDGTSLWHLTHARDLAVALVGLLGNRRAIGEAFHITGDEALTWNQIFQIIARAAGAPDPQLVRVASDAIARNYPEEGPGLVGDKAHSVMFDNSKVKALVPEFVATTPYWQGAAEMVAWYDADPARGGIDPAQDAMLDALIAKYGS